MVDERIKQYFQEPRKIRELETDEKYNLVITFDNGERRLYRMKERLTGVFTALTDIEKFRAVFIDEFGNAAWDINSEVDSSVHWENRIDICKDALYLDSELL